MFQFNPFTGTLDLNSGPGSYLDDVVEYASLASFPVPGEAGKIYVDLSSDRAYRWPEGGTSLESYREVSPTDLADLPAAFFDRAGNAQTRPPTLGQTQHQVVLANDTRLFDARQVAWVQPPVSPFFPVPTPVADLVPGTQYSIAVVGTTDWFAIGLTGLVFNVTAPADSDTLSIMAAFGIQIGMLVTGAGIAPGTTVLATSASAFPRVITLSQPTTAALTDTPVTFASAPESGNVFTKNSTPGTGTGSAIPLLGNPEPPDLGTMAYDGAFLYILVPTPGNQSVRWARTPLSMTW